jgi:hypothetical protein
MAKKTDINKESKKRTRIRYECPAGLQDLFDFINLFPPLDDWVDFPLPVELAPLFLPNWRNQSDLDKEQIKKIKKLGDICLELFDYGLKLGITALAKFIRENEHEHLEILEEKYNDAIMSYRTISGQFRILQNKDIHKNILNKKLIEMRDCEKDYYMARFDITRVWSGRYEQIKLIKKFLAKLAFINRNFESANKKLHIFDLLELDRTLSNIYVDNNGILQREDDIILQTLLGSNITRIRQCALCRKYFWANRIDRKCCEKKCADVHNQQNHRKRKQNY